MAQGEAGAVGAAAGTELCYSRDGEEFNFESLGDLLCDMQGDGELAEGAAYYEADARRLRADDFVDTDAVTDGMHEQLHDLVGSDSAGDEFILAGQAAAAELHMLLRGWIEKHVDVGRYWRIVGKVRERRVTAEDVAEVTA